MVHNYFRRLSLVLLASTSMLVLRPVPGFAQVELTESKSEHHDLIQVAASRLIEIQESDGAWPYEGVYRVSRQIPVGYRIGGTAIVCQSLLESSLDDRASADKAIVRGLDLILKELEHPLMKSSQVDRYDVRVWGHIYALDLFCRLHESPLVAERAESVNGWIEKLIATLAEEELTEGGWNYASRGRHASFVTAPALQALISAKSIGKLVPPELFERGAKILLASRSENGAFHYSGTQDANGREAQVPGAIARDAIGETTLWQLGHGDAKRLKASIDDFHLHWDELEKRRQKTGTHEPPYNVAPYYFYFGHRYLAQSIALLPADQQITEYAKFEHALLKTLDADNTWNDRVFPRSRAFGTAMSLLALNRQRSPLPILTQIEQK